MSAPSIETRKKQKKEKKNKGQIKGKKKEGTAQTKC